MSSLWTPEGEHQVEHSGAEPGEPTETRPEAFLEEPDLENEEVAREFAELEQELLAAPVEDVIANHCYGIFQLAALHLGQRPPNFDKARLAIDALAGIVDALGDRLGPHQENFTDGLAQLRLAYVQLHGAGGEPNGAEPSS